MIKTENRESLSLLQWVSETKFRKTEVENLVTRDPDLFGLI